MKDKIPVAVVGAGNVADRMHLPAWAKIPEVEVVAVCDLDRERAERMARKWQINRIYTDFNELLEGEKCMIVDICTPPSTHMPLSVKTMERGRNVILEKPLAMSIEESAKILSEYQRRKEDVKLCIVHNYLFSPSMLELKSVLKKRKVDVLGVDIRMIHTPNDEMISDKNHWTHSLPGGRFGECLIHPVYLLWNLLGELNVRDVWVTKRGSYDWVKYDELHATFDSREKFGSIYISFNGPRETSFPTIRIYGRNLILNFDGTNSTLTVQGHLNTTSKIGRAKDSIQISTQILSSAVRHAFKVLTGKWKSGHENLFKFFIDSIVEGKGLPYTPEEAFKANKIFLEVLERLP